MTLQCSHRTILPSSQTPYIHQNASPKAVSLIASCLITWILISSQRSWNSADRTRVSAPMLVTGDGGDGFWHNCYIETTHPISSLLTASCLLTLSTLYILTSCNSADLMTVWALPVAPGGSEAAIGLIVSYNIRRNCAWHCMFRKLRAANVLCLQQQN